ncbi:MAG: GTPase Era [Oligoflexales bacterium]|nr:GTPase Era [Oligoflexales bacterium]
MTKRCGYISFLGLTNAGKSTLLNSCVGQKLAGVSRKPQTTRNRILGVAISQQSQFVFLDTPGFYYQKRSVMLHRMMNEEALSTIADSDVICYLIDVKRGCHDEDINFLSDIVKKKSAETKLFVVLSKCDSLDNISVSFQEDQTKNRLALILEEAKVEAEFLTISAKSKDSVKEFLRRLEVHLPEREWDFPEDSYTDRSENFVVAELIREKFFRLYGQELPFGTGVQVTGIKKKENITVVSASLIVSREAHKGIVIGKSGAKLKELGTLARTSLEVFYEGKVYLELSVKVKVDWTNDQRVIAEIQGIAEPLNLDELLAQLTEGVV